MLHSSDPGYSLIASRIAQQLKQATCLLFLDLAGCNGVRLLVQLLVQLLLQLLLQAHMSLFRID